MGKNTKQSRAKEVSDFVAANPRFVAEEIQKMLAELCPSDCCACRWHNLCDTAENL